MLHWYKIQEKNDIDFLIVPEEAKTVHHKFTEISPIKTLSSFGVGTTGLADSWGGP